MMAAAVVLVAALAAGALWLATGGGTSSSVSSAPAARRLVVSSLAAALSAGSFHYVSSSTSSGVQQLTVGNAASDHGMQVITVSGDTFKVLVIGAACFFQGDATAMVENLGLSPAAAQTHAGQWISLATGDAPYQSVYAAVTTASALHDNVTFTPARLLTASTVAGHRVEVVQGPLKGVDGQVAKGTATLEVTAGGRHLPVSYTERGTVGSGTAASSLTFRIDFSGWGEAVPVTAPTGAIAFSSLPSAGGGQPGGTGPVTGTTVLASKAQPTRR